MEKEIVKDFIDETLEYYDEDVEIDEIVKIISDMKNSGATHINISGYDENTVYIRPIKVRKETDEEYQNRIKRISHNEELDKAFRRSKYLELKKEFGND